MQAPPAAEPALPKAFWRHALRKLGVAVATNHVLWGIVVGLVLSLSTVGRDYLNPGTLPLKPNGDFVEETGFIDQARLYSCTAESAPRVSSTACTTLWAVQGAQAPISCRMQSLSQPIAVFSTRVGPSNRRRCWSCWAGAPHRWPCSLWACGSRHALVASDMLPTHQPNTSLSRSWMPSRTQARRPLRSSSQGRRARK